MKFLYQYKTSENRRRDGVVSASSRDAAYAKLKRDGIRPFRLDDAPGFFNKLFGRGKRWMAIVALFVVALASTLAAVTARRPSVPRELPRQQIVGDQFVLEDGLATQWQNVLSRPGDRWLAMYAMPGRKPRRGLRISSPVEIYVATRDLEQNLSAPVELVTDALAEYRQLRAIVERIKRELRERVAAGGSVSAFLEMLESRQQDEVKAYADAVSAMKAVVNEKGCGAEVRKCWLEKNAELRAKGLMGLPGPEHF